MSYRSELAAQLAPPIEAKDDTTVNMLAFMLGTRYSEKDWYDTFIHVLRAASEDVWHFWMEDDCPCRGDPLFHER